MTISYASELIAPRSSADNGQAAENTLEAGSSGMGRGDAHLIRPATWAGERSVERRSGHRATLLAADQKTGSSNLSSPISRPIGGAGIT